MHDGGDSWRRPRPDPHPDLERYSSEWCDEVVRSYPVIPRRLIQALGHADLVDEDYLDSAARRYTRDEVSPQTARVLACMSQGMTQEAAGDVLHIAYDTVRSHLKFARHTLHAKNTSHAIAIALRRGIIA